MRIAWIGDTHADPNHDSSLQRFKDMGRYVAQFDCDVVVQIGDWFDMPSITSHRGRLEAEGDRYHRDIEVGNDALATFMKPFRRRKKKMPTFEYFVGNHEYRIERFLQQHPEMSGYMSLDDMEFQRYGWNITPFGRYKNIEGFWTTHHILGKTGKAVSLGPTFTRRGVSMVVGHTHEMQHLVLPRQDTYTHGIDLGCMTARGYTEAEDWSAPNANGVWRGIHIMDGVHNGDAAEIRHVRAEIFTDD